MSSSSAQRIRSLDGLRGVAALVVLLGHIAVMVPTLSLAYDFAEMPSFGSPAWWVALTPLHILWAGPEAVQLFFVLSGIVLTLSARRADFDWFAYYPRRIVRLYVPVCAAVLLAAASMLLIPRSATGQSSTWLSRRAAEYSPGSLRTDLSLLWGDTDFALSPLWSLRWEVWFSLALPIFGAWAFLLIRWWPAKLALVAATLAVGIATGWPELLYLPVFAVGSLVAVHWGSLQRLTERALRRPYAGFLFLGATVILLTARWWPIPLGLPWRASKWLSLAVLLGAVCAVLLAAHWDRANRVLTSAPLQWLGRVSFSLYLVHETAILTVRHAWPDASMITVALIAIPAALATSWVFFLIVERPSMRLARKVGRSARETLSVEQPQEARPA
ncbi:MULTISPECIES: acyltransferase [unclassified Leucobacter]|uniref:acyltransferase family protein n=1 Tax=unclassified Leucobacter TaxID=2621730 RepID=UPI001179C204|nr:MULTISPECIES: acyltransferase [unclassified Leucobacter]